MDNQPIDSKAVNASDESKHMSDESRHSSDAIERHDTMKLKIQNSTAKSFGVRKSEVICAQYSHPAMIGLSYFCVFLVAYTYGLDNTVRYQLQTYAQSSYAQHSLISTVNVIKTVIAAASQPTYAMILGFFFYISYRILYWNNSSALSVQ